MQKDSSNWMDAKVDFFAKLDNKRQSTGRRRRRNREKA